MKNPLELAAKRTLAKITSSEETLKPLYLQPDRAIFLTADSDIILKVYVEGRTLEKEYATAQKAQARGVPVPGMLMFSRGWQRLSKDGLFRIRYEHCWCKNYQGIEGKMETGKAILLINMLASELGYELKWARLPNGVVGDSFRLDNHKGEGRLFRGPKKYEQALQWLRAKV